MPAGSHEPNGETTIGGQHHGTAAHQPGAATIPRPHPDRHQGPHPAYQPQSFQPHGPTGGPYHAVPQTPLPKELPTAQPLTDTDVNERTAPKPHQPPTPVAPNARPDPANPTLP